MVAGVLVATVQQVAKERGRLSLLNNQCYQILTSPLR